MPNHIDWCLYIYDLLVYWSISTSIDKSAGLNIPRNSRCGQISRRSVPKGVLTEGKLFAHLDAFHDP
jgi:hypothetical protein